MSSAGGDSHSRGTGRDDPRGQRRRRGRGGNGSSTTSGAPEESRNIITVTNIPDADFA